MDEETKREIRRQIKREEEKKRKREFREKHGGDISVNRQR